MSEWKEILIDSVCSRLSSGKAISSSLIKDEGYYPVYGGNGIRGFTNTYNFDGECAIIGRQGASCGNVRYFSGKAYMTEHAVVAVPTEEHNAYYLSCVLASLKLGRLSGQSAQPGIGVGLIGRQIITMPSLATQQKIASILSSLDSKIAINRRICENLEAQAQALFKHWFIDFAPFKDGQFVDSELGMIPEGWRIVTLNEACLKVTDGSHYSPKDDPLGSIPMLSVKDMQHNGFDYSSCKKISEEEYTKMKANDCVPLKNDILVAKDGSYLKEIFLCFEEIKQAILSSIAIFRSNNTIIYPEILLQILRLPKIRKDVGDNYVSGTALPRIVLKDFKKYRFVIAPIEVQDKIIGTFRAINALIYKKEQENLRLATLRDTLLPKLMSGQIKV